MESMLLNASQLLKESIGSTRAYKVSETVDIMEEGDGSPVEGDVKLTRTNRGILVQGKLRTVVKVTCSRCLCLYDCPLSFDIEEEFFPVIDVFSGIPVEMPEEPGYFTIDEHHILDLTEAIRQGAIVNIHMKPLCREECAGLCAQCGRDLNQGTCDCPQPGVDKRWSKLAELKKVSKRKKG
ncbi:MAG: DUF177 domain-containing protein [Dehalococcoidia bacterium]|nr:DUF177 domain-containing protein [Dehalococcoidia bacterium]